MKAIMAGFDARAARARRYLRMVHGRLVQAADLVEPPPDPTQQASAVKVISSEADTQGWTRDVVQAHPMGHSNWHFGYWSSLPLAITDFTMGGQRRPRRKFDAVIVGAGISGSLDRQAAWAQGQEVLRTRGRSREPAEHHDYMHRFYKALAKVPEIPYPPEIFTPPGSSIYRSRELERRSTDRFYARATMAGPKQAYLIEQGRSRSRAPTIASAGVRRVTGSVRAFASCRTTLR